MSKLSPLIAIAVFANASTFFLYAYAAGQPGGSGFTMMVGFVLMPILWTLTILVAIAILIVRRSYLFSKPVVWWTLLTMLFTTPVPLYLVYHLVLPYTYRAGASMQTIDGKVYKKEYWTARSGSGGTTRFFTADSAQVAMQGGKAFKKDSAWVYLGDAGDTVKIEQYKNDRLISVKRFK